MKQKVVVIGHGYTSRLGVIRALGRAGYEVIVIVMTGFKKDGKTLNTTRPIDCYSKYVYKYLFCNSKDEEGLVQILLNHCIDSQQKVVIIPDSDFSAAVIDKNQNRLRDNFLFPHINNKPGAVIDWMDKVKQKQTARTIGLDVAEGWTIEVKDGRFDLPSGILYPCFPKPMATLVGGKSGLKRCDNEQELRQVVEELIKRSSTISILVEEFKQIETEHALMGISDGKKVFIPGITQALSLANGFHFGVAKLGMIRPVTGYENFIEKCKCFVLETGFVGIFDIDFYLSKGHYYFCEMNFRYGGSGYSYTFMGVNLPVMMVRCLLRQNIDGIAKMVKSEATFVNERMCFDDLLYGYMTKKEYHTMLNTADISFIKEDDDKKPYFAYLRYYFYMQLKRIIKKLIKR